MDTVKLFHRLKSVSTLTHHMRGIISKSTESDWKDIIEMNCLLLTIDDFKTEPDLVKFIEYFGCHQKLAIYRFKPNTCYKWHIDHQGRNCCINMLIDGYDSLTMFGTPSANGRMVDVTKLVYEQDKYALLNVHKFHTIFNFSEYRYLLSIGVPSSASYDEVKQYLIDNNI